MRAVFPRWPASLALATAPFAPVEPVLRRGLGTPTCAIARCRRPAPVGGWSTDKVALAPRHLATHGEVRACGHFFSLTVISTSVTEELSRTTIVPLFLSAGITSNTFLDSGTGSFSCILLPASS